MLRYGFFFNIRITYEEMNFQISELNHLSIKLLKAQPQITDLMRIEQLVQGEASCKSLIKN